MSKPAPFQRLIRFETDDGVETYGDLPVSVGSDAIVGSTVDVLKGDFASGFRPGNAKATVSKLLSPVPPTNNVPCIGLNYRQHATEAKLSVPNYPVVFSKPPTAITGPFDDVHIHPDVQSQLDYEGELTAVIARDCKNVSAADALDCVLGYTIGNDLSARDFQRPPANSGGQYTYAKSFDGFAPFGPCITSAALIGDPQQLTYTTKVNGELRQRTSTNDMIWPVARIIEHLSRGTTLRAGTAIMTGTPSGVGLFMEPQTFLRDGDVVEVEVEKVGVIRNQVVFER